MRPEIKPAPIPVLTLAPGTPKAEEVLVEAEDPDPDPVLVSLMTVVPVWVPEVVVMVDSTTVVLPVAVLLAIEEMFEEAASIAVDRLSTALVRFSEAESMALETSVMAELAASVTLATAFDAAVAPGMTMAGAPVNP